MTFNPKKLFRAASSFPAKVGIVLIAAVGGIALVSSSVFAVLTATASNATPMQIQTGVLSLTMTPSSTAGITAGFTTNVANMAPGDSIVRFVDVNQGANLAGQLATLKVTPAAATALTTDATNGLQVAVQACSVAWSYTAPNASCSGTTTTVLSSTSVNALGNATALSSANFSTAVNASNHLQVTLSLPAGSEITTNGVTPTGTVQGLTTNLTWAFSESLRTNTTTLS